MIALIGTEDGNGRLMDGMRQPSHIDILVLAQHVGATLTVPAGANHVLFSGSTNFFVKYTADAMTSALYAAGTVAASGVCSSDGAELNPGLRSLKSVTGLSVIAPAAGLLSMSWFG